MAAPCAQEHRRRQQWRMCVIPNRGLRNQWWGLAAGERHRTVMCRHTSVQAASAAVWNALADGLLLGQLLHCRCCNMFVWCLRQVRTHDPRYACMRAAVTGAAVYPIAALLPLPQPPALPVAEKRYAPVSAPAPLTQRASRMACLNAMALGKCEDKRTTQRAFFRTLDRCGRRLRV